jgi:cobalt/nickel transport system ATP-binding protein
MQKPIIKLENIIFGYNERLVLNSVSLEIKKGERIGLIGPNGSGKTTLLYLIMGFLKPYAGKIEIFGKERKEEKDFVEVRRRIGFLFQDSDSQLFCPTVKEDIAFGPFNLGKSRKEVLKIVEETVKIFGITHLLERPPYKLSGGEKKLVAFATIVAMKPECYLLDEPSTGLDEETKEKIKNYLLNQTDTYLIVSHDKEFLFEVAKKIYYLKDGKLFSY